MILTDNINILQKAFPSTLSRIKKLENSLNKDFLMIEDTKKGIKTISINREGKKVYLHSKYDPIREAETIINEYKDISNDATIIFYGTGLGYHIDLFLKRYPYVNYYIYEPIPEVLFKYLEHNSLKKLPSLNLKDIIIGDNENLCTLDRLIDRIGDNYLIVTLNSHVNVFADEYKQFIMQFKNVLKNKRNNLGANLAFQKRWIINSMKNFGEVLSTPNILLEKRGQFKGKPAVLVAAGPSLNEEIENIRHIKENGLAYIFTVGSAINTLIYHNIYPDAACTYDPTEKNQIVFQKVKEEGIREIPMIFGSSVGYETILDYQGRKYHMITSQDTVSEYYLKNEDEKLVSIVQDAPSIAVVTLQLLYELGFSPIILVGQNLGYRDKKRYSEGISYAKDLTNEDIEKGIWIKDVYGNEILTNESFNSMRLEMEYYIHNLPNINVINTTKGGAHIKGTSFIELEEVIKKHLTSKIVDKDWIIENSTKYDRKYLDFKLRKMDREYEKAIKINKDYKKVLDKIDNVITNKDYTQAENLYIKLDKELRKIENNDFYKTFILPMNRVQYKILADSIDNLNEIRDPYEKGRKISEKFRNFIDICIQDIEMIEPIYKDMREVILSYTKSSLEKGV